MKLAIGMLFTVTAVFSLGASAKLKFIDSWEFEREEDGIKAECRTHESGIDRFR